jgi:hypothetical protein
MGDCLRRLINRYLSDQTTLIDSKDPNEIARFLLKLDSRKDKVGFYRQRLLTFQREPMQELSAAMARFTNLLDKIYPPADLSTLSLRENLLKTAVISFLPDQYSIPMLSQIKRAADRCEPLTYESILKQAISLENYEQVLPRVALTFGRNINAVPVGTQLQFNSIQIDPKKRRLGDTFGESIGCEYPHYNTLSQYMSAEQFSGTKPHIGTNVGPNAFAEMQSSTLTSPDTVKKVDTVHKLDTENGQVASRLISPVPNLQQKLDFSSGSSSPENTVTRMTHSTPMQMMQVDYSQIRSNQDLIPQRDGGYMVVVQGVPMQVLNVPPPLNSPDPCIRSAALIARQQSSSLSPNGVQNSTLVPSQVASPVPVQGISASVPVNVQPVVQLERLQLEQQQLDQAHREHVLRQQQALAEASSSARMQTRAQARADMQKGQPEVNSMQMYRDNRGYNKPPSRDRRYPSREQQRYPSRDRQRYPSKEQQRYPSKDRRYPSREQQRYPSRDRQHYPSKEQQRYPSRDRQRFPSREQQRYPSKDNKTGYYGNSRDRNPLYEGRKSYSKEIYVCKHCGRNPSKSPHRDKVYNQNSRGRSPQRKDGYNRDGSNSRFRSREKSAQTRALYPEMRKGVNCSIDYYPVKSRFCSKCTFTRTHHEFLCPTYSRYNQSLCSLCERGHHLASECKSVPNFPPKESELNSVFCNAVNAKN